MKEGRTLQKRYPLSACLLVSFLAGCQAPPARPTCGKDEVELPRKVVLTKQILADTAVEWTQHPLRTGYNMITEPGAYLEAWAIGAFYKRLVLPCSPEPPPIAHDRPRVDPESLEQELLRLSGVELQPADVRMWVDGGEALAALHRVIDHASRRLDVLMYLWGSDPLGEEVAAHLAARAGPGLRVRVLVDGGGNLTFGEPKEASAAEVNRVVCWLARQPYVEVLRSRNAGVRFDHRKLVVADGDLAWSGGRNFDHQSFFEAHDVSYTLAGPLAADMEDIFETFWKDQGGTTADPLPPPPDPVANASARLLRTRPVRREFASVVYRVVDRARHHVYVENPYFADARLLVKLARARQRGVDVRVVLTIQGDVESINRSNKVTANRMLQSGIRVYLYPGMTHVKATAVDDRWIYLGSGNFDALSLRHNRELGLAVSDGPFIGAVEECVFQRDMRPEWELTQPLPVTVADYLSECLASLFL